MTVQSVPDATSSPSVDQEVPSVSHPVPFRFSFDPPSDPASVSVFIKAYPNLPGYHMRSTWDRLTAVSTYGPPGSEEDDEPDSGWDFSELDNPSAMRDFMTACDYYLSDCSDSSHSLGDEDCGPSHECFHVDLWGLDEGNHLGMPEDGDPPRPAPRVDILWKLDVVPVLAGGQDAQLEQIREMQARLNEEAGPLVQLRQNIGQEWAGRAPAGEARHLAQDVQHRIADDPVIGNVRLTKVLMDGGSSLNIIYAETLGLLQIELSSIRAGATPFHGIIPGKRVQPLGQLDLPVCFGTPSNFRKETLTFEVVGFRGTYHAMLGRPCYAKFMAVPNYTYLKLKMPGPNGVITVGSTYRHAYECDVECVEYAEALAESKALIADLESLSKEAQDAKRHAGNFEPTEMVKSVPLDPSNDVTKQVRIGSELDPK
jgi:hypothetical protein